MHLHDMPLATMLDVVRGAIMVLFILSSLLVILVVLAQEGKGGGLAGAFGGAGAETFGVKAGTVNKFTAWLAAAFLGLALLHAGLSTAKSPPAAPSIGEFEGPTEGTGTTTAGDPAKDGGDSKDAPKGDGPKDGDPKDGDPKDDGPKDDGPKDGDPKDDGSKDGGDSKDAPK